MDRHGCQHMDPMHLRPIIHLRNLLLRPQINPGLRSVHSRHCFRLQGRRRHRRSSRRPPLLRRRLQQSPPRIMDHPHRRSNPVLRRIHFHMGCGLRLNPPATGAGDVLLHVFSRPCPGVLQHRQRGYRRP